MFLIAMLRQHNVLHGYNMFLEKTLSWKIHVAKTRYCGGTTEVLSECVCSRTINLKSICISTVF